MPATALLLTLLTEPASPEGTRADDENQMPTGRDLVGLQRRLLRELWDWTPAQLDEAWREWVAEQ